MNHVRSTLVACCVALLVLTFGVPAVAQTSDDKTFITFSGPVALPGTSLGTGTYVFRLAKGTSDRHIVQVMDKDGSRVYALLMAMPAQRAEITDETVITFAERGSTAPPAIRYWFYPSKSIGHEFVYPKEQAMRIARASNQPVLATESRMTTEAEMTTASVTTIQPSDVNPDEAEELQGYSASAGTTGTTELPKTASPLPLAGVLGLMSLAGALGVRTLRRRRG